jgi:putative ABC transport system ATP-binding protein
MILSLSHIYKTYYQEELEVPVLKDINLTVEQGDYLAIMGPSGSGKSTLMNLIGCLDLPTQGEYIFEGQDILNCSENALAEVRCHRIGFVFQNFQLLKEETALGNCMLPLSFAGVPYGKRKDIAAAALKRVGLGDRMDFHPTQLSGGQKQRVAIARALVNNPAVLLADEPTGALDQSSGRNVMELFGQLNEEGVTIIMITHDANIAAHAKQVIHLVDGRITEQQEAQITEQQEAQEV